MSRICSHLLIFNISNAALGTEGKDKELGNQFLILFYFTLMALTGLSRTGDGGRRRLQYDAISAKSMTMCHFKNVRHFSQNRWRKFYICRGKVEKHRFRHGKGGLFGS